MPLTGCCRSWPTSRRLGSTPAGRPAPPWPSCRASCRQAGTSAVVTIRGGLGQSVEIPTGEPPDLIAARVNRRIRHLTETLVEMGVEVDR